MKYFSDTLTASWVNVVLASVWGVGDNGPGGLISL